MIQEHVSLKPYNSFGVEAQARYFAEADTFGSLEKILGWYREQPELPLLVLGGGSNVILTQDWPGLALHVNLKGKMVIKDEADEVLVQAQAGEDWHEFVLWTLDQGLNGLENLSLIPGNVGASPMQNIGAYGVEIKDVFQELEALNIQTGQYKTFNQQACRFGYRESVFKHEEKGQWIIMSVTFSLRRDGQVKVDYGTIQTVLTAHGITDPTPKQVAQAVTAIRQSKLPDPKVLGSAGSFFKNPSLSPEALAKLQKILPAVPHFKLDNGQYKVPAGYLIDQAGWKGFRNGACGVHKDQALVLVNYGGATGAEIWQLALRIQASIKEKYKIKLWPEVNKI